MPGPCGADGHSPTPSAGTRQPLRHPSLPAVPQKPEVPFPSKGEFGVLGGQWGPPPAALGCGVRAGRAPRSRAVPQVGTCLQINHPGEQCGRAGNRLRAAPSRRLNIYLSRLCLPVTDRHFQGGARFCSNTRSRALPEASAGNGATKHAGFPGDGGPRVLPGHSTHGTEHPAQR